MPKIPKTLAGKSPALGKKEILAKVIKTATPAGYIASGVSAARPFVGKAINSIGEKVKNSISSIGNKKKTLPVPAGNEKTVEMSKLLYRNGLKK